MGISMDFYRIDEKYNQFLQRYEKEKRGVTKVPNLKYADRDKFAFGAVMKVNGINYYSTDNAVPVEVCGSIFF